MQPAAVSARATTSALSREKAYTRVTSSATTACPPRPPPRSLPRVIDGGRSRPAAPEPAACRSSSAAAVEASPSPPPSSSCGGAGRAPSKIRRARSPPAAGGNLSRASKVAHSSAVSSTRRTKSSRLTGSITGRTAGRRRCAGRAARDAIACSTIRGVRVCHPRETRRDVASS
eukprot:867314-Prymnesium_polylepis.1